MAQWFHHRSPRLGAALAFYAVFAMGPLLLIVTAIAGLFFGEDAVRGSLTAQFQSLLGPAGSNAIQALLAGAAARGSGKLAVTLGVAFLVVGAVGLVGQLKDALNTIWNVEDPANADVWWYVRTYAVSAAAVLALGLLLAVSLVISAALAGLSTLFGAAAASSPLIHDANFVVSLVILSALFAALFKFFPDTEVPWSDVLIGGALTGLLFTVGKDLIGWYIGSQSLESTYGAAASILALLIWVYYSAQILLIGAELTHAYAAETGSRRHVGPHGTSQHKADATPR